MVQKLLAFSVPGSTNIPLPGDISRIVSNTGDLGANIIGWALVTVFVAATMTTLGFIIWGGLKWITSHGDPKSVTEARETIIYAATGLGIVLFSAAAINFAVNFFCVPLLGSLPSTCH